MSRIETSVLIIGAGPVGLAMALELGSRGTDCIVVEQVPDNGRILLPRASGISTRTMEFCRHWGIDARVRTGGFPLDFPLDTVYCTSLAGYELGRHTVPAIKDQPRLGYSPETSHRLPQFLFDPILERSASEYPTVDIRHGTRLLGFEQNRDGVVARVARNSQASYDFEKGGQTVAHSLSDLPDFDETLTIRAQYLVACDGVRSGVRDALGVEVKGVSDDGNPVLSYSVSALVRLPELERKHDKGNAAHYVFVGTHGIWGNLTAVDGSSLWRLSLVGSHARREYSETEMMGHLAAAIGRRDFHGEIVRFAPWTRRQAIAAHLKSGRVLLAGDAAHAMSPTGGYGMNTGLGDVIDLGWKLEAVLRGWGGAELLHSYDIERGQVAWRNTRAAANNFQPWQMELDFSTILRDSAAGESARSSAGEAIREAFTAEWDCEGISMGYRYTNSPICIPDGTPEPFDDPIAYTQSSRPGGRAPHMWLEDGKSTLDLFGEGFTLLCINEESDGAAALKTAARNVGVPLQAVPIKSADAASVFETRYVLVRPDGHVAWRGNAIPAVPGDLIDVVRGARGSRDAMWR